MKIVLSALNARYTHSSLALRYIQKYCSAFDISIREFTINQETDKIYAQLFLEKADVYGFSCYIWNTEQTLKVCARLKAAYPKAKIMLGGPEAGEKTEQILKSPFVDYVITGEGERATFDLLCALKEDKPLTNVLGIAYREGQIKVNPPQPPLKGEEIPMPYEKADLEALQGKMVYYEASRGCPFQCSYCLSGLDKCLRLFDMEKVERELLFLMEHKVPLIKFVDRTFNCNKERTLALMRFLLSHSQGTKFHFEIAADLFDDETLAFLTQVPQDLFQFEIGVQSTNEKTLAAVGRKTNLPQLFENVKRLRANSNIHLHLDLIAGLPYEDYESFGRSFDAVYALQPHMLQLGFLKLLPGSRLEQEAALYGIKASPYAPYEVVSTNALPAERLVALKGIEEVLDRYYNSGVFPRALPLAVERFESPFAFYEQLAAFFEKMGYLSAPHAQSQYYAYLHEFMDDKNFDHILAQDFLLHNPGAALPPWAQRRETPGWKQACNAFLETAQAAELIPWMVGLSRREVSRLLRIEPLGDEIFMADFKQKRLFQVTKIFQ